MCDICARWLCYFCLTEQEEKLPKTISLTRYEKTEPIAMPALAHATPISIIDMPEPAIPPISKNKQGIINPSVYHSRDLHHDAHVTPVLIKH
jgi:hypothetical protein